MKLEQEKYNTNTRLKTVNLDIDDDLIKCMIINPISPPAPELPAKSEKELERDRQRMGRTKRKASSSG